jgi:glycerol-3-phosphate dehydrogenase
VSPGRPPPTAPMSPRACASRNPAGRRGRGRRRGDRRAARPPARHVASAVGVWTDGLRELAGAGQSSRRIVPSKGIHVFVARDRIWRRDPRPHGESVLFVIPGRRAG